MKSLRVVATIALLAAIAPLSASAQALPGKHPGYLHALSDLRAARWFLNHQPGDSAVSGQEDVAITEIDAAIGEIKKASIDDGKGLDDHPQVDIQEHGSRLLKAIETLKTAKRDITSEEDNPEVRGLRARADDHIAHAIKAAEDAHALWLKQPKGGQGAQGGGLPGAHPGYLHALSDLRSARWFLYHQPGDSAVAGQEDVAITEIDAAIGEIKKASIDDGKNLDDHPAVDIKEHGSRLLKAIEALKTAKRDITSEEDNPEVRGLRARADVHIANAIKAAEDAHTQWLKQVQH